jgi:hypothetical protein
MFICRRDYNPAVVIASKEVLGEERFLSGTHPRGGPQPPPPNPPKPTLKKTDFCKYYIKSCTDFPFSKNQPLNSADN